jgi:predicted dehydrogenase
MLDTRLRAAIVGLGQVGMLFDQEAERTSHGEHWTHFSAYEALKSTYTLVAVVDPDIKKRQLAVARNPKLRAYGNVEDLLSSMKIDVVSVCTPDETHLNMLEKLTDKCAAIFLEKPVCGENELNKAKELIEKCRNNRIAIRINYYKRFEPLVRKAKEILWGKNVMNVAVRYSGPFLAVGSHAVNLMLAFAPNVKLMHALCHQNTEGGGYTAGFMGSGGQAAQTIYCGNRNNLIFTCEINWDGGALHLERNLSKLRSYIFTKSTRYANYNELEFEYECEAEHSNQRFVGYLEELANEVRTGNRDYSSLESALETQSMMEQIIKSA